MRIKSFSTFIQNENTTECCLKNCSLVIDGQNFFYNAYEESNLTSMFGSEANEYAKYLRKMMYTFKQANVKCYVVFKGGDTDIDKKIKKRKFQFKLDAPVFHKEVCKQVLEEFRIKHTTCVMESKADCAALTLKLGCSVLSNDIEYCFNRAPYIISSSLQYTLIKTKDKRIWKKITCSKFNLDKFFEKHSLTNKKFAIFAALTDENIFEAGHFDHLFDSLRIRNKNLNLQNKALLHWLSEHSEDEIQDNVSKFLTKESDRKTFHDQVDQVLDNMENDHGGVVVDYLSNDCKLPVSHSDPNWFEKGVAAQNIAPQYINLFKHRYISGPILLADIIKYAYNLLTNYQASEITMYQDAQNYVTINTEDSKITKPVYQCSESVFENGWEDVKPLRLFEHFLKENNINTDNIDKFPVEAKMLFIALSYFARKKTADNIDVTKEVYCFIISYVMLHYVFDKNEVEREKNSGINSDDSAKAMKVTATYFKCGNSEAHSIFNRDKVKVLFELQHCLLQLNYLNALCGTPFNETKYHKTFNGTFIFKLLLDMTEADNNEFIEKLFETAPSVLKFINSLINSYKETIV